MIFRSVVNGQIPEWNLPSFFGSQFCRQLQPQFFPHSPPQGLTTINNHFLTIETPTPSPSSTRTRIRQKRYIIYPLLHQIFSPPFCPVHFSDSNLTFDISYETRLNKVLHIRPELVLILSNHSLLSNSSRLAISLRTFCIVDLLTARLHYLRYRPFPRASLIARPAPHRQPWQQTVMLISRKAMSTSQAPSNSPTALAATLERTRLAGISSSSFITL